MNGSLGTAAALGAVTGLRTMAAAACVAQELSARRSGWPRRRSRIAAERWLADDRVAIALTVMAAGELLFDKLPGIPPRISPAPLLGRTVVGGLLGAVVVDPDQRASGAVAGAMGAVAGAAAGWFLRREAARATMMPDAAIAVAEDAFAIAAARELAAQV